MLELAEMNLSFAKMCRVSSALVVFVLSTGSLCAEKILYLGDSLSMGSFGRTMDAQMREAGHEVFTYVTGGATPYYWLSIYGVQKTTIGHWEKTPERESRRKSATVPKVEKLLKKHWPEVVVVQTGVNLYAQLRSKQRSKKENIREVTMLVRNMGETIKASGAKCFWVTPPDSHVARYPRKLQDEMFQIMKLTASRYGPVFNSQEVTTYTDPYPRTDGIHYGSRAANAWGGLVAEEVNAWLTERKGKSASRPLMAAFRAKQLDGPGLATFAGLGTSIPGVALGKNATPVAALVRDAEGAPKTGVSVAGSEVMISAAMKKTEDSIAAAEALAVASAKAERIRKEALEKEAKEKVRKLAEAKKIAAAEKKAKAEAKKRAAELAKAEEIAKAKQLAQIEAKKKKEAEAKKAAESAVRAKMIAAAKAKREANAKAALKVKEEKKAKAEVEARIAARAAAEKKAQALASAAAKPKAAEASAPDVYKVKRAKSSTAPSDAVSVDIKLIGISKTPAKNQINYGKALAVYEWEVVKVRSGTYEPKNIRIAHTVYWGGKPTSAAGWKIGRTWSLDLKVLSAYPQVAQWQTFNDLDVNLELPVYLPKM